MELPPSGVGVTCGDQDVPFQPSASSPDGPAPAASHECSEAHDTELSEVKPEALGWADQDAPFQISTWPSLPAAMQKVAEVHDTDVRAPPGTTCRLQALPFHISAPLPALLELDPTASQKRAETHDTPARLIRRPLVARAGFGVFWIFQVAPFHTSARETVARPMVSYMLLRRAM